MPRFGLVGEVFPFRGQDCIFPETSFTKSRQKKKYKLVCWTTYSRFLFQCLHQQTAHISNSTNAHEHCPHQRDRRNQGAGIHLPAPECICPNLREKHTHKKREKMTFGSSIRSEGWQRGQWQKADWKINYSTSLILKQNMNCTMLKRLKDSTENTTGIILSNIRCSLGYFTQQKLP